MDSGTSTETGDSEIGPASLTEHGTVVCAEPELRDSEGPMMMLDHGASWESQTPDGFDDFRWGTALAVEDFDDDGYWDVLLGHASRPQLFRGRADGSLVSDTEALPVPEALVDIRHWNIMGVAAGDLDGDGDPDLILSTTLGGVQILRNEGEVFTDATPGSGMPGTFLYGESLPLGDLDGDGDLDLFVGQDNWDAAPPDPGYLNGLFLNRGDGTFEDVSDQHDDVWRDGYTKVGTIADLDMDGDQDLYVVNHHGSYRGNVLLLTSDDGVATDPEAGLDITMPGMGVGLGDVNEDGLPDLFLAGWGTFALMESAAPGLWVRTEKTRELFPNRESGQEAAWGTELADLDNDGDLDALSGFGPAGYAEEGYENPEDQPDGIWIREGEVFVDVSDAWGMAQKRNTKTLVVFDYNGDGWLDVLKCGQDKKARLWTARCGEASWILVDLVQSGPNPRAIGARVEATAGDKVWTRWLTASSTGYRSSPPPQLHFGLGQVERLDVLKVTWPDGGVDTFTDVDSRQRVTVERP